MNEFWAILWLIIKYGFIAGFSLFTLTCLFVLFHPIYLTLKGRGSIKGQRGEVKVSYLFGLLRLRYIASAHTQDLWLEFFKFRKLLERETVIDEKKLLKQNESKVEKELSDSDSLSEKEELLLAKDEADTNLNPDEQKLEQSIKENEKDDSPDNTSETLEDSTDKEIESENETLTEKESDDNTEKNTINEEQEESIDEQELPKVEATPEQLAELQKILEEEERKEKKDQQKKNEDKMKALADKIRKLQDKLDTKFKKVRKIIILIKEKWASLWPVAKRFWNRGKKGFRFHDAYLKVEYSLDEHYLTGMSYGYIAPTIGFAKSYGVTFEPIPIFPSKPEMGVYSKASWNIDILPYKLIWAIVALIFEKNIYKELIWLYKMKKNKK